MFSDFPPQHPDVLLARSHLNWKHIVGISILTSGQIALFDIFNSELLAIRNSIPSVPELKMLLTNIEQSRTTKHLNAENRFYGEPTNRELVRDLKNQSQRQPARQTPKIIDIEL